MNSLECPEIMGRTRKNTAVKSVAGSHFKMSENGPSTILYALWPDRVYLSRFRTPLFLCQRGLPFGSKYEIWPPLTYLQKCLSRNTCLHNRERDLCYESVSDRKWRKVTHWTQNEKKKKKKPNNCWSVKVWKFSFPFPLGAKESFQGPEIVKCYFSSPFFEAQGNLKSYGYSSLVTIPFQNWGLFRCCVPFRPPAILCCALCESYHVYGLDEIVESFLYSKAITFFLLYQL